MQETTPTDDFDAAKRIFEELKGLTKERQERVLRWVSEGLGLTPAPHATQVGLMHDHGHRPPASGPTTAPSSASLGSGRDIRTFVAEKAPTSDNQFAAVVAYYYRFEAPESQRRKTIGGADLQEAARLAGRKRLANPRQTLKNAKNMGYLDNTGRGEFSINTVGENLVAMTLPGGAEPPGVRNGGGRSRSGGRARRSTQAKNAAAAKKSGTVKKGKKL